MNLSITGVRIELDRVLAQQPIGRRGGRVHVNLSGQQANTLLHDGQAWKDFSRAALGATRRAIRAARAADATFLVHTSFAFVDAVERGAKVDEPLRPGKTCYSTDGHATAFEEFMDAFAHRIGRPNPMHLPLLSPLLARLIIREEHMQRIALAMPHRAPAPRVPGWEPRFPDYRAGFDQVVAAVPGAAGKTSTPLASPTELCRP